MKYRHGDRQRIGAQCGESWGQHGSRLVVVRFNRGRLESVNPATGEVIARVTHATAADYEQVVGDAQRSFTTMAHWCRRRSGARSSV